MVVKVVKVRVTVDLASDSEMKKEAARTKPRRRKRVNDARSDGRWCCSCWSEGSAAPGRCCFWFQPEGCHVETNQLVDSALKAAAQVAPGHRLLREPSPLFAAPKNRNPTCRQNVEGHASMKSRCGGRGDGGSRPDDRAGGARCGGGRGAASQQHAFALPVVWRRGKATNARRRLGGVGTERADDGTIGIRRRAYIRWPAYSSVADGCSSVSPTNGGGLAFRRQTYRDPMEFLAEEALARLDSAALSSFT